MVSQASTRGHYFAGFAFDEYDLFLMQGLDTDTMIHEATHLLVHQATESPLARVPAWLNEGLAMQFEDSAIVRSATVRSAARADRLLSLKNMGAVPGRSRDITLFYAQAWSVVDYMMDTYGPERISALLAEMNSGQRIDEALVTVYGLSVDELDQEWRNDLLGTTPVAPRPDPGTVGTSVLLTGAAAAAIATSAWPWIWRWLRGPGQSLPPEGEG